ncbi:hypothetical protein [Halobaculum sp. EA56]|uniref:hypothetical protein n=1 Tax=Halobaculum sp. EA56 TaxID=3421648 RepID=UPI003EBAAD6E
MSAEDGLSRAEITDRIARARSLIQEVRDEAPIPVVAHSAHQADMYCHRLMWELGEETANTPELEEPVDPEGDE